MKPVEKSVRVSLTQAEAFKLFTDGIASWWPLATHSVSGDRAVCCTVEPRVGGRIYETGSGGRQILWGAVIAWEPPSRLVFSWHPGREAEGAQEVEVLFEAHEGGTRIVLTHRGWQKLGDQAESNRRRYDTGWDTVLGDGYLEAAEKGTGAIERSQWRMKVKTFASELKPFYTMRELEALDDQVNAFLAENRIDSVVSVSDTSTTDDTGATIGIIRVIAYED